MWYLSLKSYEGEIYFSGEKLTAKNIKRYGRKRNFDYSPRTDFSEKYVSIGKYVFKE